jgi:hypothetical protein
MDSLGPNIVTILEKEGTNLQTVLALDNVTYLVNSNDPHLTKL